MSAFHSGIVDDREYRRGMVLGLTLAEVLLLMLFLLMLALGTELIELRDKLTKSEETGTARTNAYLDQKIKLNAANKKLSQFVALFPNLRVATEIKRSFESSKKELEHFKNLIPDLKLAAQLKLVLDAATQINPDDPPEALRKGIALQIGLSEKLASGTITKKEIDKLFERLHERRILLLENADLKSQLKKKKDTDSALEPMLSKFGIEVDTPNISELNEVIDLFIRWFKKENSKKPSVSDLRDFTKKKMDGQNHNRSKWPPIINLSEAGGHFFERGSATLTDKFSTLLRTQIPMRLVELLRQYEVDTVEVIGHTDELPIRRRISNLDDTLLKAAIGGTSVNRLVPADNAGLGMARAVSVMKILRADPRLKDWEIIPLSGAQMIRSDGRLSRGEGGEARERRRIEIRLRGSSSTVEEDSSYGLY